MHRIAAFTAALLAAAPLAAQEPAASQPEDTYAVAERSAVTARDYMVVAANPLAAEAGRAVLGNGGSAADAAVAVQAMLNLVEPQSSGIGGGAFMLYWDASADELVTYDGRETAPMAATPEYWLNDAGEPLGFFEAVVGGRSVGVPGTLALLEKAHDDHGRTPWADLFAPAIATAEAGFEISPRLASSIADAAERQLALFPETRAYFFNEDGSPRAAGTILKNPALARSFRLIAAEGAQPFYTGAIAGDIVAAVKTDTNPGILTMEDLSAYEAKKRPPVCVSYRVYEVCGMGPPTSGGLTVGQILKMLEPFDLASMGPTPEAWHLYAEASKLAFADRNLYMGDADFVKMPTEGLIDPLYLASRSELIDPDTAMEKAEPGEPPHKEGLLFGPGTCPDRPGTSHFVVVDRYGDMVSMTTTIETGFGSRVMTDGFLLNNELTDFSFTPESDGKPVANRVEGGKRPRSSMSPTIVLRDGDPVLLVGSPGGSRIIGYVAQALIAMLDWNMDPQTAVALGHVVNRNGDTDLEAGTDAETLAPALEAMGHGINIRDLNSGLHAIRISDGTLTGGADPRREGVALGD